MTDECIPTHYGPQSERVVLASLYPWWNPMGDITCIWAAYQPKGAASFAISILDLSGNGNDAVDPGAPNTPTWNATDGWDFDGINDYLITTFTPQNDQTQTMIVQYTGAAINDRYLAGSEAGIGGTFFLSPRRGGTHVEYANGSTTTVVPALAAGNLCIAGNQGYRDGAAEGFAIGVWTQVPAVVYIGCWETGGLPAGYTDAAIQALALYDCTLTAAQVLAVATAMAAL